MPNGLLRPEVKVLPQPPRWLRRTLVVAAAAAIAVGCSAPRLASSEESQSEQSLIDKAGAATGAPGTLVTTVPGYALPNVARWAIYRPDGGTLLVEGLYGKNVVAAVLYSFAPDGTPTSAAVVETKDLGVDQPTLFHALAEDFARDDANEATASGTASIRPLTTTLVGAPVTLAQSCRSIVGKSAFTLVPAGVGLVVTGIGIAACTTVVGCIPLVVGAAGGGYGLAQSGDWHKIKNACLGGCGAVGTSCGEVGDCCEGLGCAKTPGGASLTCAPAFDCSQRQDGSYCGPGDTAELVYDCKNKVASVRKSCAGKCAKTPDGHDDCLPPPDCGALADGDYCGVYVSNGDAGALYHCAHGKATLSAACKYGCRDFGKPQDCAAKPDCGTLSGPQCGRSIGSAVVGDSNADFLYNCPGGGGDATVTAVCAGGCGLVSDKPACLPTCKPQTTLADGDYCGPAVQGEKNTLYHCTSGAISAPTFCDKGCSGDNKGHDKCG